MKNLQELVVTGLFLLPGTVFAGFDPALLNYAGNSVRNLAVVNDSVLRGGNPFENRAGIQALADLKIDLVIDLQGGDIDGTPAGLYGGIFELGDRQSYINAERVSFETRGITFVNEPLNSHALVTQAEDQEIDEALSLLKNATSSNPVYIHCEHGQDRTGLLVALYRVFVEKWSVQKAYNEWLSLGHGKFFNQFATKDLDKYFAKKTAGLP